MVKAKVFIDKAKCNLCYLCTRLCPTNVFKVENGSIVVRDELCIACYGCVKLCLANAITINVTSYTIVEFVKYGQ